MRSRSFTRHCHGPREPTTQASPLTAFLFQRHLRGSAGPYSHPAQRVPGSMLQGFRGLTTQPTDTGRESTLRRRPSGTAREGYHREPPRSAVAVAVAESNTRPDPLDTG
ncbi:Hypothetical predicted protein [Marmota monax]|uniref:Uncharacterized protein n=1 Tax=Marmota monax TaxID=9995 RepID=A0A5E4AEG7_MARMO|nr:Hypothetical predicted protein [Marmota monax]